MQRESCATCAFVNTYQPGPNDPREAADVGWCHRNPPVMVDNANTSHFPPVSLSKTWCGAWRPKVTQ